MITVPGHPDAPTTFGDLDLISFGLSDIGQDIIATAGRF
jgi:hypothetical protein